MLRRWKARFVWLSTAASSIIAKITHWEITGREGVRFTKLQLRNRYNYKVKLKTLDGEWVERDFPGNTYRG